MAEIQPITHARGRRPCTQVYIDLLPTVVDRLQRALDTGMTAATNRAELIRWLINDSLFRVEQAWVDAKVREAAIDAALQE